MNTFLEEYLKTQDYNKITDGAIDWIRSWFAANGPSSPAVIGISGGKDSTIVATLCKEALGADRVYGILMPNAIQPDIDISRAVVDELGIKSFEINIHDGYEGIMSAVNAAGFESSRQAKINLAPRLRMSVLYATSQCVGGRVSNNSNRSERYVGYSTVYGDSVGDFSPLANLTVTEVRKVGACLGISENFVFRAPSDGLTGNTDEDNLGFTYEQLDTYILTGICLDSAVKELIDARHRANAFKLAPMPTYTFK